MRDVCIQCFVEIAWITYHLLASIADVDTAQMFTRSRVSVVNPGDSWHLDCEFYVEGFNLFDNPILWKKIQGREESQINMMGNLLEPFESTNRFRVAFTTKRNKFTLSLTISQISSADSGNYTCEIGGPQNVILGEVTHYVFVRAPVDSVTISYGSDISLVTSSLAAELVLIEHVPVELRCTAEGGYPPPDLSLQIGSTDLTNDFIISHKMEMTGSRSLRIMHYTTTRWSTMFYPRASYDGKDLICVAAVAGLGSNHTKIKLVVKFVPIVNCETKSAMLDERNVYISCHVIARPRPGLMFWIIDNNGTALGESDIIKEYWTLIADNTDGSLDIQLYMRRTTPSSFRKYPLVVENLIGSKTAEAFLTQRHPSTMMPSTYSSQLKDKEFLPLLLTPKYYSSDAIFGVSNFAQVTMSQRSIFKLLILTFTIIVTENSNILDYVLLSIYHYNYV